MAEPKKADSGEEEKQERKEGESPQEAYLASEEYLKDAAADRLAAESELPPAKKPRQEKLAGKEIPDTMDSGVGKPSSPGKSSERWQEYRFGIKDGEGKVKETKIPQKDEPVIGRDIEKADFVVDDPSARASRLHAKLVMKDGKPFIQDLGSKNGTTVVRDGQEIEIQKGGELELKPGDIIKLGKNYEISFSKPGPAADSWKPRGYESEKSEGEDKSGQKEKDLKDPAASKEAREASNSYLQNHEFAGKFPNGFQVGGAQIDEKGFHNDSQRPSVVIDTRAGKDPALEKFLQDCARDLAHLKDNPEKLAEEIAKRAKEAMQPAGWSEQAVDEAYKKMRGENAGKRLLLGDFMEAAKRGLGAGTCNHQSILTKLAFDSMYEGEAGAPKMKLVRGFYGDRAGIVEAAELTNHAWVTLEAGGKEKIFDPRLQIYGEQVEARPSHNPGKEIPQLKAAEKELAPELPKDRSVYEKLIGKDLNYQGKNWKLASYDPATGKAQIISSGSRPELISKVQELNPGKELVVGETYTIRRSNGKPEGGWKLLAYRDPQAKDELLFVKENAYERSLPIEELRKQNEQIFAELENSQKQKQNKPEEKAENKPENKPASEAEKKAESEAEKKVKPGAEEKIPPGEKVSPAADKELKASDFGIEEGRQVKYQGSKWYVAGVKDGKVELVQAGERPVSADEFKELNGDRQPKVGEEINIRRSNKNIERWRLISCNPETGAMRARSETAYKETVLLQEVLAENPRLKEAGKAADVRSILNDPASKLNIECRWTDGNSGHNLFVGSMEGKNGEVVRVMIHKPPYNADADGRWHRLNNDLAAQQLAQKMGAPGLFPETAFRDGMMVQKFVGYENRQFADYLHDLSRQDAELRAAHPKLEDRIFHMMEKADPKLRAELARAIAFSALLGDHDQHGMNFVLEQTGPKASDLRIARIDTDYAFSAEKEPQLVRKGNYGSVVNGLFRYFSEKELPADVRAQVKLVHDELNPADQTARRQARQKFAQELKLSIEQVDALADRARYLAEGGKFPRSYDIRQHGEEMKGVKLPGGEKMGTVKELDAAQKLLSEGEKRALDLARDWMKKRLAGLDLQSKDQRYQALKSCLEEMDELPAEKKPSPADRDAFAKLLAEYAKSDSAKTKELETYLGFKQGESESKAAGDAQLASNGNKADAAKESVSIAELQKRLAGDPVERARVLKKIEDEGPIRQTLKQAGMEEKRARELERDLLSEREETRKKTQQEIDRFYETRGRGGFKGFAKEASGRLGALVMVAAAVLPWVIPSSRSESDMEKPASWSGGQKK